MSNYKSWLKDQKKKINKNYDKQVEITKDSYNEEIDKAGVAYEGLYRQNEVDRLVNQKRIAEANANLGLTNSGLNRTQQTAIQLSHSNRDYEISKARQDDIDDLALEKAKAVTEINLNRQNAIAEAEDQAQMMKTTAAKTYSSGSPKTVNNTPDYSANWEFIEVNEDGKYVFKNGDEYEYYNAGVNPYTGKKVDAHGFDVWNGYQPKGVYYNGTHMNITDSGRPMVDYQGHDKRIWRTREKVSTADGGSTDLWIWDDYTGSYRPVRFINGKMRVF